MQSVVIILPRRFCVSLCEFLGGGGAEDLFGGLHCPIIGPEYTQKRPPNAGVVLFFELKKKLSYEALPLHC
jgi:hypothetical protein